MVRLLTLSLIFHCFLGWGYGSFLGGDIFYGGPENPMSSTSSKSTPAAFCLSSYDTLALSSFSS